MGLRRRGPGLSAIAARARTGARPDAAPGRRLAGALALCTALALGCSSTADQDQARFDLHRENAQSHYDRGDPLRALHQANRALELQPRNESMRLIKGFSLLKLGSSRRSLPLIDEALEAFDGLNKGFGGSSDFRVHLGLGSAHLARALQTDREADRLQANLASDFLSEDARRDAQRSHVRLRTEQAAHLRSAERALRRVLAEPRQQDNAYAITDLALTIQLAGGREDEAVVLAERALALLLESGRITRSNMERNASLSAAARLDLQRILDSNDEKERSLRDLVATIHWSRGNSAGFLDQLALLEQRGLLGEVQYWNRSLVLESLGRPSEAVADLEQFLRLRARRLDYEADDKAPEAFRRIEALRARFADGP